MDVKLKPRPAGDLHLGAQADQVIRFHGFDPPEIQRLAHAQAVRIAPAAAHPHPAD